MPSILSTFSASAIFLYCLTEPHISHVYLCFFMLFLQRISYNDLKGCWKVTANQRTFLKKNLCTCDVHATIL